MEQERLISACNAELHLVLRFFPRVDTKASVILGVDAAMVGYLSAHFPATNSVRWWECISPTIAFALLAVSFWYLYHGAFPRLKGGERSLIYFREIASRMESKFIDEFTNQQEPEYIRDTLGQVWRNSDILSEKFACLKLSFLLSALAVLPWAIALIDFAIRTRVP